MVGCNQEHAPHSRPHRMCRPLAPVPQGFQVHGRNLDGRHFRVVRLVHLRPSVVSQILSRIPRLAHHSQPSPIFGIHHHGYRGGLHSRSERLKHGHGDSDVPEEIRGET